MSSNIVSKKLKKNESILPKLVDKRRESSVCMHRSSPEPLHKFNYRSHHDLNRFQKKPTQQNLTFDKWNEHLAFQPLRNKQKFRIIPNSFYKNVTYSKFAEFTIDDMQKKYELRLSKLIPKCLN